jgi:hypothetical protein
LGTGPVAKCGPGRKVQDPARPGRAGTGPAWRPQEAPSERATCRPAPTSEVLDDQLPGPARAPRLGRAARQHRGLGEAVGAAHERRDAALPRALVRHGWAGRRPAPRRAPAPPPARRPVRARPAPPPPPPAPRRPCAPGSSSSWAPRPCAPPRAPAPQPPPRPPGRPRAARGLA